MHSHARLRRSDSRSVRIGQSVAELYFNPILQFLLHIAPLHSVQIPQDSLDRPHKSLFESASLTFFNGNEVLDERHTRVRTNTSENVPPAVQFEEEAPWKTDGAFECCDVLA
jgi:hypothetical protein